MSGSYALQEWTLYNVATSTNTAAIVNTRAIAVDNFRGEQDTINWNVENIQINGAGNYGIGQTDGNLTQQNDIFQSVYDGTNINTGVSFMDNINGAAAYLYDGSTQYALADGTLNGNAATVYGANDITIGASNTGMHEGVTRLQKGVSTVDSTQYVYVGTSGSDNLAANHNAEAVYGFGGNNTLSDGGHSADSLFGGTGNDTINMSGNNGLVVSGTGTNTINVSGSGDQVIAVTGTNTINGTGTGTTYFLSSTWSPNDTIHDTTGTAKLAFDSATTTHGGSAATAVVTGVYVSDSNNPQASFSVNANLGTSDAFLMVGGDHYDQTAAIQHYAWDTYGANAGNNFVNSYNVLAAKSNTAISSVSDLQAWANGATSITFNGGNGGKAYLLFQNAGSTSVFYAHDLNNNGSINLSNSEIQYLGQINSTNVGYVMTQVQNGKLASTTAVTPSVDSTQQVWIDSITDNASVTTSENGHSVFVGSNETTADNTPTLNGWIGQALISGQTIRVFDGATDVTSGTATVNADLSYSVTTTGLSSGSHNLTVKVLNADNSVAGASSGFTTTVHSTAAVSLSNVNDGTWGVDLTGAYMTYSSAYTNTKGLMYLVDDSLAGTGTAGAVTLADLQNASNSNKVSGAEDSLGNATVVTSGSASGYTFGTANLTQGNTFHYYVVDSVGNLYKDTTAVQLQPPPPPPATVTSGVISGSGPFSIPAGAQAIYTGLNTTDMGGDQTFFVEGGSVMTVFYTQTEADVFAGSFATEAAAIAANGHPILTLVGDMVDCFDDNIFNSQGSTSFPQGMLYGASPTNNSSLYYGTITDVAGNAGLSYGDTNNGGGGMHNYGSWTAAITNAATGGGPGTVMDTANNLVGAGVHTLLASANVKFLYQTDAASNALSVAYADFDAYSGKLLAVDRISVNAAGDSGADVAAIAGSLVNYATGSNITGANGTFTEAEYSTAKSKLTSSSITVSNIASSNANVLTALADSNVNLVTNTSVTLNSAQFTSYSSKLNAGDTVTIDGTGVTDPTAINSWGIAGVVDYITNVGTAGSPVTLTATQYANTASKLTGTNYIGLNLANSSQVLSTAAFGGLVSLSNAGGSTANVLSFSDSGSVTLLANTAISNVTYQLAANQIFDATAATSGLTIVSGGTTADTITGGSGADNITVNYNDFVTAGTGTDTIVLGTSGLTLTNLSKQVGGTLNLDVNSKAAVALTTAEFGLFSNVTDTGNGASTITFSNNGAVTLVGGQQNSHVTYQLANGNQVFSDGLAGTSVGIAGGSGSDTITINNDDTVSAGTGTDTIVLGTSGLTLTNLSKQVGGTLNLDVNSKAAVTLTTAEFGLFSNVTDTGNGASTITFSDNHSGTQMTLASGQANNHVTYQLADGGSWLDATNASVGVAVMGGNGDDTIAGGVGADVLNGGAGDDTFVYADLSDLTDGLGNTIDQIDGGASVTGNVISLTQTTGFSFTGGTLADGRIHNIEELHIDGANSGAVSIGLNWDDVTNLGIHTVDLSGDTNGTGTDSVNLWDTSTNFTVIGSAGDDIITAGEGSLTVNTGAGNDSITGHLGNDTITGGAGADVIDGGAGDDVIIIAATGDDATGESYTGGSDSGAGDTLRIAGISTIDLSDDAIATIENLDLTHAADGTVSNAVQTVTMTLAQRNGFTGGVTADATDLLTFDTFGVGQSITATSGKDTFSMANTENTLTITGFDSASDVLNVSAYSAGNFVQTGATLTSDFLTKSVFIFDATEVTIAAAAAAIAADANDVGTTVNATNGIIVIKSSVTHNVEVYYTDNAAADGTETLLATLVGVDITTLNGTNITA